jgi:hypothetical protein
MARQLEDGSVITLGELLASQGRDPNTGATLTFSQVGSTGTYVATTSQTGGKTATYRVDVVPNNQVVTVSRTVA